MKKFFTILGISILALSVFSAPKYSMRSIQKCGVLPTNTPEKNTENLQKAIDEASLTGGSIFVDPIAVGYPMASGLKLKENVSLIGSNGPVPRGTKVPNTREPAGSVFRIMDANAPFITVESATQIRGIQFYYPNQTMTDPTKIIEYPPTIMRDKTKRVEGVTLSNLTFMGEFVAMDFKINDYKLPACELILIEHCYGYPLSGEFIKINRCFDIPRILHCHVNPAALRGFKGQYPPKIVDTVIKRKTYTYYIEATDNAQLIDIFTFGTYGGIYLGKHTYGQLTNFNLDCVCVGIYKDGDQDKNRNWMISQGSIIANTGDKLEDVHPFVIRGKGHTAITNVEAFSGGNGALSNLGKSYDFMLIEGNDMLTVSIYGCRMRNYASKEPITIRNPKAKVRATDCLNNNLDFFNFKKN